MISPLRPTTATDTFQPLALQSAMAVEAMVMAASAEMSLRESICAEAGTAIAQVRPASARREKYADIIQSSQIKPLCSMAAGVKVYRAAGDLVPAPRNSKRKPPSGVADGGWQP